MVWGSVLLAPANGQTHSTPVITYVMSHCPTALARYLPMQSTDAQMLTGKAQVPKAQVLKVPDCISLSTCGTSCRNDAAPLQHHASSEQHTDNYGNRTWEHQAALNSLSLTAYVTLCI